MNERAMEFNLNLIELPKLNRVESPSGRTYVTPEGNSYPSVTTVLGKTLDKSGLDAWRKRIGEEEADKQSKYAANRGTIVHDLCEDLILNRAVNLKGLMPIPLAMYRQFERILRQNVDNVRGSELFLYSDKLKVAGATDLIADWDGVTSVIDFKTSGKHKKREWIDSYFLQCALYAYMMWERTGVICKNLVVIIGVEMASEPQVFIEDTKNWIPRAMELCKTFHQK